MNTDQRPGGISGHGPGIPAGVRITSFRPGAVSIEAVAAIENDEVSHQGGDDQDQDQDHDKQETTSHEAGADDSAGLDHCSSEAKEHENMEPTNERISRLLAAGLSAGEAIGAVNATDAIAAAKQAVATATTETETEETDVKMNEAVSIRTESERADYVMEKYSPPNSGSVERTEFTQAETLEYAAEIIASTIEQAKLHNADADASHAEDIRRRVLTMASDLRAEQNERAEQMELYQDQRNNIMREHDKANRAVYDAIIQTNTTTSAAYADAYETRAELEAELAALDREAVERGLIPDPEETTTSEPTAYEENARDENNRRREWTAYEAE